MKQKQKLVLAVLIAVALLTAAPPPRAEFSADISDEVHFILILSIIEDPDPVPVDIGVWDPVRVEPSGDILNFQGNDRGDGPPDTAIDPQTNEPLVAWAYRSGADHDIAISEWAVDHWGETRFLTSDSTDQLDPRAHIDSAGRADVAWWTGGGAEKLFVSTRDPGSSEWGLPKLIAFPGRRPSVVRVAEGLLVAFERDRAAGGQEIVLAALLLDGSSTLQVVAETERVEPLDVKVHFSGGDLWVDWKHGEDQFAYSVDSDAGWTAPVMVPWDDKSWVGEEEVRKVIRSEIFAAR